MKKQYILFGNISEIFLLAVQHDNSITDEIIVALLEATPKNNYKADTGKGVTVEYIPKQLTA